MNNEPNRKYIFYKDKLDYLIDENKSKIGKKFIPPMHIDLGQGLLQLIKDLTESNTDFS